MFGYCCNVRKWVSIYTKLEHLRPKDVQCYVDQVVHRTLVVVTILTVAQWMDEVTIALGRGPSFPSSCPPCPPCQYMPSGNITAPFPYLSYTWTRKSIEWIIKRSHPPTYVQPVPTRERLAKVSSLPYLFSFCLFAVIITCFLLYFWLLFVGFHLAAAVVRNVSPSLLGHVLSSQQIVPQSQSEAFPASLIDWNLFLNFPLLPVFYCRKLCPCSCCSVVDPSILFMITMFIVSSSFVQTWHSSIQ